MPINARFVPAKELRPFGFSAVGGFFFFGAVMATLAAATLLKPGTALDRAWALNPIAHVQLMSMGRLMGVPFLAVAFALLMAGVGWFRRRRWGWMLGTSLIVVNLIGDLANAIQGERMKGVIGVVIAGLLLVYMTRPRMRSYFVRHGPAT